jgi:hypothetical protein
MNLGFIFFIDWVKVNCDGAVTNQVRKLMLAGELFENASEILLGFAENIDTCTITC